MMIGWWGGLLEVIASLVGAVASAVFLILQSLPDGWLFMTLPLYACGGGVLGLLAIGIIRLLIWSFQQPRIQT
jgi:hypothetical protein